MRKLLLLVVCLMLVFVSDIQAEPQDTNKYTNSTLGLSIVKPEDWHFLSIEASQNSLNNVRLKDKQIQEYMRKYSSKPIVVITKYPESYSDVNPSLKINIKPFGRLPRDPHKIMEIIIPTWKRAFRDFEIIQEVEDTMLGGLPATHVQIHYSLENNSGEIRSIRSDLWIAMRGDYFFLVGSGLKQDESNGSYQEIKQILDSLDLTRSE